MNGSANWNPLGREIRLSPNLQQLSSEAIKINHSGISEWLPTYPPNT